MKINISFEVQSTGIGTIGENTANAIADIVRGELSEVLAKRGVTYQTVLAAHYALAAGATYAEEAALGADILVSRWVDHLLTELSSSSLMVRGDVRWYVDEAE